MIDTIKKTYAVLDERHPTKVKIVRYLISGGMAAFTDLLFLYIFTDIFGIWYILSAIVAFLLSFLVSFSMQKYWTFKDHSSDRFRTQAVTYLFVTVTNLGINTLGIFLFVQYVHLHYMISQIIVSAFIAIESFFVYQVVFKQRNDLTITENP